MEEEDQSKSSKHEEEEEEEESNSKQRRALLILNCVLLTIGNCGGPLIMRLYFVHGGHRVWLSSFLETAGCPLILLPLAFTAIRRRRRRPSAPLVQLKPFLFAASAAIGLLTGLDDYLYAYGVARLPVSTSALIIAAQLGFTAAFAFLLVRQRFTAYSVNSVVLLTLGGGVLALHAGGDRPAGESSGQYVAGFLMTVAAAALYGFILPLIELSYKKGKQKITYSLVLEIQMVMCVFATALCTIGMIVNNDFKVIPREAKEFGLGETKYYVVLVFSAIIWQGFFLGAIGVIFCSSSLLSGIVIAALLPVTEVLAVIFYKEKFQAEKGVSLALSLWGFVSYFYGEMKQKTKEKQKPEIEVAQLQSTPVSLRQIEIPNP